MSASEPRRRFDGSMVPIGNLASLLVPVGLVVAQLVLPAAAPEPSLPEPAEVPLGLSVLLEPHGFIVVAGDATVALTCTACDDPHAPEGLVRHLRRIKDAHPDAMTVVVVPGRDSDYATLMRTIRAARSDDRGVLFPQAIIAGEGG